MTNFAIEQAHQKLTVVALSRVHVTAAPPASRSGGIGRLGRRSRRVGLVLRPGRGLSIRLRFAAGQGVRRRLREYAACQLSRLGGRSSPRRSICASGSITNSSTIPKATTVSTPLPMVLELRRGVCQDFAHLAIGCLRSLGLAARYVSGYLLTQPPEGKPRLVGSDASHAWLSVYTGNSGWLDFDPTNNVVPSLEHITLAWGRDYSDVCPIQGVFIGGGQHGLSVSVDVAPLALTCGPSRPAALQSPAAA